MKILFLLLAISIMAPKKKQQTAPAFDLINLTQPKTSFAFLTEQENKDFSYLINLYLDKNKEPLNARAYLAEILKILQAETPIADISIIQAYICMIDPFERGIIAYQDRLDANSKEKYKYTNLYYKIHSYFLSLLFPGKIYGSFDLPNIQTKMSFYNNQQRSIVQTWHTNTAPHELAQLNFLPKFKKEYQCLPISLQTHNGYFLIKAINEKLKQSLDTVSNNYKLDTIVIYNFFGIDSDKPFTIQQMSAVIQMLKTDSEHYATHGNKYIPLQQAKTLLNLCDDKGYAFLPTSRKNQAVAILSYLQPIIKCIIAKKNTSSKKRQNKQKRAEENKHKIVEIVNDDDVYIETTIVQPVENENNLDSSTSESESDTETNELQNDTEYNQATEILTEIYNQIEPGCKNRSDNTWEKMKKMLKKLYHG